MGPQRGNRVRASNSPIGGHFRACTTRSCSSSERRVLGRTLWRPHPAALAGVSSLAGCFFSTLLGSIAEEAKKRDGPGGLSQELGFSPSHLLGLGVVALGARGALVANSCSSYRFSDECRRDLGTR